MKELSAETGTCPATSPTFQQITYHQHHHFFGLKSGLQVFGMSAVIEI
jgi:hypothetical protein